MTTEENQSRVDRERRAAGPAGSIASTNEKAASDSQEHRMTVFGTLSIGGLIKLLEQRAKRCDSDESVRFDFGHMVPSGTHSYRGFYDHLAIGYDRNGSDMTISQLVAVLKRAIGATFSGWKGGDFVMREDTPVWCDEPGDASSTAIVGIADCDYMTILETRHVNV